MKYEDIKALRMIKFCRDRLTVQQYRTLKGQVLSGQSRAAMQGLTKILGRRKDESETR